jgi:hypothetical protein
MPAGKIVGGQVGRKRAGVVHCFAAASALTSGGRSNARFIARQPF